MLAPQNISEGWLAALRRAIRNLAWRPQITEFSGGLNFLPASPSRRGERKRERAKERKSEREKERKRERGKERDSDRTEERKRKSERGTGKRVKE